MFITQDVHPGGVGECAARLFGRDGANVIIAGPHATLGRELADELVAAGGNARFVAAQLDDVIEMAHAVDTAGAIDILVNNADSFGEGSARGAATAGHAGDAWYEKAFESLALTCAVVPTMAMNGSGTVITLASVPPGGDPALAGHYVAALEKLTAKASRRWADGGVSVNSIAITRGDAVAAERAALTVLDLAAQEGDRTATTLTV